MKRIKLLDIFLALGPVALYLILVWQTIGKWSIWFDEAFSAYLMRYNVPGIFHYTAADVHPPLYYVALKGWTSVFGDSDVALRSLSAVFIAIAIGVGYFFIKKMFGRRAAFVAMALAACSPMLIRFGQEARMYGMVVLIAMIASWVLYEATLRPTRRKWIIYAVLVAIGMWTHYFMALVWLAHWLWRAFIVYKVPFSWSAFRRKYFSPDWLWTHALAIALYLPWLPFMAIQLGQIQGNGFWIRAVDADTFTDLITSSTLFLEHYEANKWYAVLAGVIAFGSAYLMVRIFRESSAVRRRSLALVSALAVAPPLILFAASLPPLKPSFVDRYLLSACLWLVATAGIAVVLGWKKHTVASGIVGFALVISLPIGVSNVYRIGNFNRDSWETMAVKNVLDDIVKRDSTKVPIVADSPWRFYEAIHYDVQQHPVYFLSVNPSYGSYNMLRDSPYRKITNTAEFYQQHPEFWYLCTARHDAQCTPHGSWQVIDSVKGPQTLKDSGTTYAYKLRMK